MILLIYTFIFYLNIHLIVNILIMFVVVLLYAMYLIFYLIMIDFHLLLFCIFILRYASLFSCENNVIHCFLLVFSLKEFINIFMWIFYAIFIFRRKVGALSIVFDAYEDANLDYAILWFVLLYLLISHFLLLASINLCVRFEMVFNDQVIAFQVHSVMLFIFWICS